MFTFLGRGPTLREAVITILAGGANDKGGGHLLVGKNDLDLNVSNNNNKKKKLRNNVGERAIFFRSLD